MEEEQRSHHQKTLIQLSNLSEQISNMSGSEGADALKRFINLYVNHQKISEDFFIALCEHNILGRLFTSKGVPTLEILEIFNLLLSNSSKQPQLVFIFSQSALHEFLFTKFLIEKEATEAIEYYVQLLKTIILKISSPETHSLIKLFCNNRYPHFPLLTIVATLAVSYEQEELVRVTANQCVLLLINLMNQTQIGLEYLSELQMVVYYHQTVRTLMEGNQEEREESVKFVVDLILALKNNVISQCILMNFITNQLFFKNIQMPHRTLHFLGNFYDQMTQNPLFPAQLCQQITFVLFRIMSKYYGQRNINYTYFTAQRIIPQIIIPPKPVNLLKYYIEKCSKIQEHLIRQCPMVEDQKELELILQQWLHFNHKNKEISPLRKHQGQKARSAFQEFFISKEQLTEQYLQSILTLAGLQKEKIKSPIHKLSYSADFQTCLYLVEYVCSRFQGASRMDMKRAYEHYTKDESWQIKIKEDILAEIYRVCCRAEKAQEGRRSQRVEKLFGVNSRVSNSRISSSKISQNNEKASRIKLQRQESQESIGKFRGFHYFLNHLKPELSSLFCASLTIHQLHPQLSELSLISAISLKAKLSHQLQPNHINLLLYKLKQLQDYITEDVFTEENYHFVFKYISKSREKSLLRRLEKKQSGDISPKKMFHNVKARIEKNFIHYEVIKKLINPSIKSLSQFLRQFWQCRFYSQKDKQSCPVTQFLYKDSNGAVLEVIADHNYEFIVKKSKDNHESATFSIGRDDCNYDKNNPTFLAFEDHKFWIDLQTEDKANDFREDLMKLRKERRQLILNGILEYLTFSYESAANVAYIGLNKKSSLVIQQ